MVVSCVTFFCSWGYLLDWMPLRAIACRGVLDGAYLRVILPNCNALAKTAKSGENFLPQTPPTHFPTPKKQNITRSRQQFPADTSKHTSLNSLQNFVLGGRHLEIEPLAHLPKHKSPNNWPETPRTPVTQHTTFMSQTNSTWQYGNLRNLCSQLDKHCLESLSCFGPEGNGCHSTLSLSPNLTCKLEFDYFSFVK